MRNFFVVLLLAVLLIGHAIDIIGGTEHWPFSYYPMYGKAIDTTKLTSFRLYGVNLEDEEFPFENPAYLYPLGAKKINKSFAHWAEQKQWPALGLAMQDCRERYNARRGAGKHDGPALKRLRLYRLQWTVDPWARNRDLPVRKLIRGVAPP